MEQAASHDPVLSVVVLTYNEEETLPDCLESLEGLDCEVYVVDSGSTDRTVEVAEKAGATVVEHPFEDYSEQRNWALGNLGLGTEWVLHLDADERLTNELRQEISTFLSDPPEDIDGFLLKRRTVFMDRWIRHGGHYPAYHLRLFRVGAGRCEDRRYDQHFLVDGETRRLEHDMIDVVMEDFDTWIERHVRWADAEAQEMLSEDDEGADTVKPRLLGTPIQRRRWLRDRYGEAPLFFRAFAYWFYRYVLRLGFLDGREGLIFHFIQGLWYRFLIDVKIAQRRERDSPR